MDKLDASALRCPLPLIRVKLWLRAAQDGERLRVLLRDPGSRQDIPAYVSGIGHPVEVVIDDAERLELIITKAP
ncbi:sulfurtransferase TusA family protein [Zobellella iuensis]|uniref:Sulfurtransferase TusA family protein n=1 Tax=Zobellella iuensis TaxID=2803811 RepID=A0ABS1QUZ0_9GAMM|nr:sulfurtransferase TusA family protein [Zobellella iuensis]MBL1378688.1 sulfurtransferase TusA family protein [Zobellella iuensis]